MKSFDELISIVKRLRAPDGCPWDKEQTYQSLTPHIIEEAYELVDAMEKGDFSELKEELGDVLLHVVMLSNMAEEQNQFQVDDVVNDVSEKMVRRHPHVFGDTKADTVDAVWDNWEKIKKTEKEAGLFDSIPNSLPALMTAIKVQKRVSRQGFDWPDSRGPLDKVKEELGEFEAAVGQNDEAAINEEFGDLLFSMINLGRKLNIDPEGALRAANVKFKKRYLDAEALAEKTPFAELSLEEKEQLWQQAKNSKN